MMDGMGLQPTGNDGFWVRAPPSKFPSLMFQSSLPHPGPGSAGLDPVLPDFFWFLSFLCFAFLFPFFPKALRSDHVSRSVFRKMVTGARLSSNQALALRPRLPSRVCCRAVSSSHPSGNWSPVFVPRWLATWTCAVVSWVVRVVARKCPLGRLQVIGVLGARDPVPDAAQCQPSQRQCPQLARAP